MKVYQNRFSPNAKRTRVVLEECGIAYDVVSLDPMKGEQGTPAYLAKNPMGKVPTLEEEDGFVLWESPATLVYFAEKHPEKKLLPQSARERAEAMRWMFWNASHLESALFAIAFEKMFKPMMGGTPDAARIASEEKNVARFAPVLEARLADREWVAGTYGIADIALGTTIEFAVATGFDVAGFPNVQRWLARVQARDAWKRAG